MCKNCNCDCECECRCHSSKPVGMLRLNEPVPDFEALTTHGILHLSDYKDTWLILFSHPSDFSPVCTTDIIGFAEIYPDLQQRGVELLGCSFDSVYAHIAWIRNIEEKTGVKVPFPLIADQNKEVASLYGMIIPGERVLEISRCVFIIDPKGKLRATINYPRTTGRNMQEILRLIDALQTSDKYQVATPANWKPGEKVVIPPPTTQEGADARLTEGYEYIDWYLCKDELE
jgi:peroxiredoxin (alkyl hydroperoxide reductase subunit C)